jgi:hypothetical protein
MDGGIWVWLVAVEAQAKILLWILSEWAQV